MNLAKKHLLWVRSNCNTGKINFLKEKLSDVATIERTHDALTKAVGALKLQEPKKAEVYINNEYTDAFCPSCEDMIFSLKPGEQVNRYPGYCLWCGQKLAWEADDDE